MAVVKKTDMLCSIYVAVDQRIVQCVFVTDQS